MKRRKGGILQYNYKSKLFAFFLCDEFLFVRIIQEQSQIRLGFTDETVRIASEYCQARTGITIVAFAVSCFM
jgi:hypothetical protein